jgi:hypothetical protein
VHEALVAERATFAAESGRRAPGADPKPFRPHPGRTANPTDPDSRTMKGPRGMLQGYNGQALVAADGLIVAADLRQAAADYEQLEPMLRLARANLAAAGVTEEMDVLVADAGYWSEANAAMERAEGPRLLIPPTVGHRRAPDSRRPLGPGRLRMSARLADPVNRKLYDRRDTIVEPVFGQLKEIRGVRRFQRRRLRACASEWQLLCATHNLLKLWRYGSGRSGRGPGKGRRPARPPRSANHRRPPAQRI